MPAPKFFGEVTCEGCPFFDGPSFSPEQAAQAGLSHAGVCRRMPGTVSRRLSDWCGEHPKIQAIRHKELAEMTAARIRGVRG